MIHRLTQQHQLTYRAARHCRALRLQREVDDVLIVDSGAFTADHLALTLLPLGHLCRQCLFERWYGVDTIACLLHGREASGVRTAVTQGHVDRTASQILEEGGPGGLGNVREVVQGPRRPVLLVLRHSSIKKLARTAERRVMLLRQCTLLLSERRGENQELK